ncbi:MAG: hypothetical protein Sapg2KO_10300 [Saprospiraceae bacterium]
MKNMKLTCCLLLAAITVFAKNDPSSFQTSTIKAGVTSAAHAQKLLMAHFVADWCMPSRWMEEHAFNHPEVDRLLKEDYLPIKVDIDQAAGFLDKEQYQVETLPTILIFSASGRLLERIEGITDPEELRQYLNKHNQGLHKQVPAHLLHKQKKTTPLIDLSHLNRPAFEQPTSSTSPTKTSMVISTPNLPMTLEEVFGPSASLQTVNPTAVPVAQPSHQVYGIEVATLKQYGAVIKYVRSLEKRVNNKVFILLSREQGEKAYHVIVGKVNSRQAAFNLRSRLLAYNIRGVVKILDTL